MDETNPYEPPSAIIETAGQNHYPPGFFSLDGRIGRLRYLAYICSLALGFNVLFMGVGLLANLGQVRETLAPGMSILTILANIIYLAIGLIYARRRLNDMDHSGMMGLLLIIPFINLLLALYLVFGKGSDGRNRFGPEPAPNTLPVKILGLGIPALAAAGIVAAIASPTFSG